MEERPSVGATIAIYLSVGAGNGSDLSKLSVNNDQSCCQLQDEETQTKKTENGKVNGSIVEGEETPTSLDSHGYLHSVSHNGDKVLLETNLKRKPSGQALNTALKGEGKGNNTSRNSMDYKNDKPSEVITHEGKKEALTSLNGVVTLNCGLLTNGYPGKPGTDNDGSGSESGYTTPKKRRAQRNGKTVDNVTASAYGKAMQPANKQDPGPTAQEPADRTSGPQVDLGRAASKADIHPGGSTKAREVPASGTTTQLTSEVHRKNSDSKTSGKKFEDKSSKVKVAASTKEDSWTLFKPPPVFPVDNSSAKIVPKISYASKVKENLNKTAQAGGEALSPAPQVPGRPSQVPMSAVKTITSASFTNGPLAGEGNGCPLPGTHFSSVASSAPVLASSSAGADNVASPSGSTTTSTTPSAAEPRKPNLFVYPLTQSSMQLSLPSGRQADPPATTTNQKSLGDIFQNQWGLSFINEPSAGPEGLVSHSAAKDKPVEVSFQGGCPATVVMQTSSASQRLDQPPFPKAYELDKRTSAETLSKGVNLVLSAASGSAVEGLPQASSLGLDSQKDEAAVPGAIVFCSSSKDIGAELTRTSPAAPKVSLAREQGHTKGFDRRSSWGLFDLKAAVVYHTKEMEYILNLQKQDPNRVVLYSESKNGPDQ
ncbi:nuclear fragile X mental retardation-interacting protein 2 isoform X1 [Colossoma macropomum]|uniref:nuclear fragile X mental retardation-interacting protein 2 isoform X1 n=2 Tax=Colossoma macropomum TaxID=42526 RepID=UPI001863B486|nr:nuclear fragile X mental retardation-interacting protein 2 isoform X1 [Colossoma macropomum]